nr:integrase, catalytic region, zinc finger, CCHC-type, peptidase aspartic, catalytic [Tanacetum cinerariifolium]
MAVFKVLETQFQMFITNRDYLNDEYVTMTRSYFIQYTGQAILEFRDTLIQYLESVKKSINERVQLKREYDSWMNERQMQTTEEKVDTSQALDASSVDTESSRTKSKEQDTSSRSGNDAQDDVADIIPIYDEEPMAEVQTTSKIDVFAIGQQHTEQPEFNNEGKVVQNAKECHDKCPLPTILANNQIPEHSYQSLEYENSCLKKTVAQFQKDFSRMEAHCVNLELKYQNNVLNKGQQSQFLKEKSHEAEVKHNTYVIETINIESEHKVAKLLKENESLTKNYKEFFDSIKITRYKTTKHTTSLIVTNDKFKAQLQEKGFVIATLKNKLRKSKGNSVNTKFAKSSILGKPMSQPFRNQSVVRQPTAFKSERPRFSKPRCDSQVDVHKFFSKPVTTHYLPKEREAASAKPHHMIASSNSRISSKNMTRFSSNDMVYNHYLEEAKKRTQEHRRNSKTSLMTSARSQSTANEHPRNSKNDSCVTKFLKEVNSRAKVSSNKTTNRNKPVEQIGVLHKQERQIPTRHRFSIQKTSVVQKKTITLRSCLRWKPTGKIFKTVGLRWVPIRRILTSSTTKVYSEPLNGSNADITNQYEYGQTLDVSADADVPSQQELDMLFGPLYDEFFNAVAESSSQNIGNSNVPTFNQPQVSEYRWTKDHLLEQVRGNPSRPVQTRRQLATDPEMCMYALTAQLVAKGYAQEEGIDFE